MRAHALLCVNNQDFSKTRVRRTSVESEEYDLEVVVVVVFHEVHGHGM